jgi:hypothetical protein
MKHIVFWGNLNQEDASSMRCRLEIAPGVREALVGGRSWCATFRISSDPNRWVQFTAGTINAAYPQSEAPETRLGELGSFALTGWAPNKYITGVLALEDASGRPLDRSLFCCDSWL